MPNLPGESVASIETVGTYVAGVETVAYREWVDVRAQYVVASLAGEVPGDLQERERLTFLAAQRAAVAYESRK